MAHGNQIGSSLRRHNSGEARHLQRVALGILRQRLEDLGLQEHEGAGLSFALGGGFCRNVDHSGSSGMIVVRELLGHPKTILLEALGQMDWWSGPENYAAQTGRFVS